VAGVSAPAPVRSPAATYARDVRVTWWYTAASVMFPHVFAVFLWAFVVVMRGTPLDVVLALVGAAGSVASGVLLLIHYRREPFDDADDSARRLVWTLVLLGIASAVLLGVGAGSLLVAVALVAQVLCTVRWRGGIRGRLVALMLVVVVASWVIEATRLNPDGYVSLTFALPLFVTMLAPLTATSLWWWDIVRELDRARRAEGRLAAAQERLRLAGDLHDLQGHHLQVIALQLELAEKMMGRDPDAAAEQVRAARVSVDELVDTEAGRAPADVLGPVVRETTTNVLKHGGGVSASLSLSRHEGSWVLVVENDSRGAASPVGDGAGLSGIVERVGPVGGTMDATRHGDRFRITVRVPEEVTA